MIVSRRRIAALLSGSVLLPVAVVSGALQGGTAAAAGDPTACINALRADRTAALQLATDWLATFNSTATGSALAKANDNIIKYLKLSRDDYFKAYQYAFKGQKSTANTWVKKGNDAIALANKAVKSYNAEIGKVNVKGDQNDVEADDLQMQMAATDQACAGM